MTSKTTERIVERLASISTTICLGLSALSVINGQWTLAAMFLAGAVLAFFGGITLMVLISIWNADDLSSSNDIRSGR